MEDNLIVWVAGGLLAGAVLNRLRGMVGVVSWLVGALIGGACWFAGAEIWQAFVVGALYVAGESWGWTKWINCITGQVDHKPKGKGRPMTQAMYNKAWAYPKQVDGPHYETLMQQVEPGWDRRDYKSYVLVGFIIRGLLWWAPVFAVLAYFSGNYIVYPLIGVLVSVAMPYVYKFAYDADLFGFFYLQKAEVLYGALYGMALGASIYGVWVGAW